MCYYGWASWGGNCYKVNEVKTGYFGASEMCAGQGARLVSINNRAENIFVSQLCGFVRSCWVGLAEKNRTGHAKTLPQNQQWVWADGTSPDTNSYVDWNLYGTKYGEPNNGRKKDLDANEKDERHAITRGGTWFDERITYQARAVCEMPGQGKLTTTTTVTTLTTTTTTSSSYLCYDGWAPWGGKCYMVNPRRTDYSSAETWCKFQGSDLVSINWDYENVFVGGLCGQDRQCWLGITEKPFTGGRDTPQSEQQWVWADGSTPRSNKFQRWKSHGADLGEPNNGKVTPQWPTVDERRATIAKNRWFDKRTDYSAHALCEMSGQAKLITTTSTTTTTITAITTTTTTTRTHVNQAVLNEKADKPHLVSKKKNGCAAMCERESQIHGWTAVCTGEAVLCHGCSGCDGKRIVDCPSGWLSFSGKCYRVNVDEKTSYDAADGWCKSQNAKLVSINSGNENDFVWKICGTGAADPIRYPILMRRSSCWLGLTEKAGSGNKDTPSKYQQWVWADGTTPSSWHFSNWKEYGKRGLGNEPNNGKSPIPEDTVFDERYVVMNQAIGGMAGYWYDKPETYKAHAVCELDPSKDHKAAASSAFLQRSTDQLLRWGRDWVRSSTQPLFQRESEQLAAGAAMDEENYRRDARSLLQLRSSVRMRGSRAI